MSCPTRASNETPRKRLRAVRVAEVHVLDAHAVAQRRQLARARRVLLGRPIHQLEDAADAGGRALELDPQQAERQRIAGDLEEVGEDQREVAGA